MNFILKYINKRNLLPTMVFLLAFISILFSFRPVFSSGGTVLDPIASTITDTIENDTKPIGEKFIEAITSSFSPGYGIYWRVVDKKGYEDAQKKDYYQDGKAHYKTETGEIGKNVDMEHYQNNTIINTIFSFSQKFGIALAFVSLLFFLLLCIVGDSEQIRDNPAMLIFKFIACILLIKTSFSITYRGLTLFSDMWDKFVISSGSETLEFKHLWNAYGAATTGGFAILGVTLALVLNPLLGLIIAFIGIFFVWKLLKCFLRMYIECAERYFVLTMMTFFFPAVCPTIISRNTSNVMQSYIKMFISQGFLLLVNCLFMKIFIWGLVYGWWTSSILGYVFAIAFAKFSNKMDSFMASLGLNVAQTGSGILASCAGAGLAIGSAIRTLSHAERLGGNIGSSLMKKGIENDNIATYNRGLGMSRTLGDRLTNSNKQKVTAEQFARIKADATPSTAQTAVAPTRKNQTIKTASNFGQTAQRLGINGNSLNRAISLANKNNSSAMSKEGIVKVRAIDGNPEFGYGNSKIFVANSADGNAIVTSGMNSYANPLYAQELADYKKNGATYDTLKNEDDYREVLDMSKNDTTLLSSLGVGYSVYECKGNASTNSKCTYRIVREVSQNPEVLNDKSWTLRTRSDGATVAVKTTMDNPIA